MTVATRAPAAFRRFHRLRRTPALRALVREVRLDPRSEERRVGKECRL